MAEAVFDTTTTPPSDPLVPLKDPGTEAELMEMENQVDQAASETKVVGAGEEEDGSNSPPDPPAPEREPGTEPEGGEEKASVYRYIKDDLFTSEIFKVEIQNLPKYIGFNDLKKFLNKQGLNPHKIKLIGRQTFAFVTFKNQVVPRYLYTQPGPSSFTHFYSVM